MLDPSGTAWGLDLAPGGVDVLSLPPGGAGSVTVSAVDHALITGVGTGGVQLTATDLDPEATGGLGYLSNFPSRATTIAENAAGPVLLEYAEGPDNVEGDGRVVVGVLPDPSVNVIDNIVRYVESLVP